MDENDDTTVANGAAAVTIVATTVAIRADQVQSKRQRLVSRMRNSRENATCKDAA